MPYVFAYTLLYIADGLSLDSVAHLFAWSPSSLMRSELKCTVGSFSGAGWSLKLASIAVREFHSFTSVKNHVLEQLPSGG